MYIKNSLLKRVGTTSLNETLINIVERKENKRVKWRKMISVTSIMKDKDHYRRKLNIFFSSFAIFMLHIKVDLNGTYFCNKWHSVMRKEN